MSIPTDKDLYAVLGVPEDASPDAIKRAYRTAAKRYHPDRTGGDKAKEARFKEMTAAYEILSNADKRRQYDLFRKGGAAGGFPPGFDPSDLFGGGAPRGFGAGLGGLGDLFEQFFGSAGSGRSRVVYQTFTPGREPRGRPRARTDEEGEVRASDGSRLVRKGLDLYSDLPISIEEAVVGARLDVATRDGRVTVTVPPGTSSGQKLRLRGKGLDGRGDHYVTVQIVVPRDVDDRARELIREFARRAPVRSRR